MIVILGCSASGKSTIERQLTAHGLKRIISYTSRPIRCAETNHIDYHFITEEEFLQKEKEDFFAENTTYNGWHYGIAKEDCKDDSIAVVEASGFRQLKSINGLNIVSFFISTPERDRVIRMMKQGDNVMESFRRVISDQGTFSGIEREVNFVIQNPNVYNVEYATENILYHVRRFYGEEILPRVWNGVGGK